MRGLKESLLSGASGFVGLCLALVASAIWGGTVGLILFATHSFHSSRPQTWIDVAMGWGLFSAAITFIFETAIVRWIYRFLDGLQETFGAVSLIVVLPVHWTLLIGRVCLSLLPVKILSVLLERHTDRAAAICPYAGVVTASQRVRVDDIVAQAGEEVIRVGKDWKVFQHSSCFGWVDRGGRIFKEPSVQHRIVDPDIELNTHPAGVIDDNKVYLSSTLIGTLVPE